MMKVTHSDSDLVNCKYCPIRKMCNELFQNPVMISRYNACPLLGALYKDLVYCFGAERANFMYESAEKTLREGREEVIPCSSESMEDK